MQAKLPQLDMHSHKGLRVPAKIVSYLFHPVYMPTVMAILVSYLNRSGFVAVSAAQRYQLWGNIGLNTIFFPVLSVLLLKALGFIDSIHMHKSKDRIIPLIATMI